jgi:hypothetical protein
VVFNRLIHANTNYSLNIAFNLRNLVMRPGEKALREAQEKYIPKFRDSEYFQLLETAILVDDALGDFMTEVCGHISDPHVKRRLRELALEEILDQGIGEDDLWLERESVKIKIKPDELAKFLKGARTIADMGVKASLQGYRLTESMKHAFAQNFTTTDGHQFEFLPAPSAAEMTRIFRLLYNPPHRSYFVYFSDDSCYSVHTPDGVKRFNVDIGKCDISHTPALFDLLESLTPPAHRENMRRLIAQCAADLSITAPEQNLPNTFGKLRVLLRSRNQEPHLLSGSTLTTLINDLACVLIVSTFNQVRYPSKENLEAAARRCGYIVTVEVCRTVQDVQFLKHSPVINTSGELEAMLNLGVLLRASGTCRGDLPGRGDIVLRARQFQRMLLQGMYPRAHFPLLDAMKSHVASAVAPDKLTGQILARIGTSHRPPPSLTEQYFSSSEIGKRYGLNDADMRELTQLLGGAGYGDTISCHAARVILLKDYGLE